MYGINLGSIETLRIVDNIKNTPSLLAIVVGMLNTRFQVKAKDGHLTPEVQKDFHDKLGAVSHCIEAMQNCAEKPPLSKGFKHIEDQMAIMYTPYAVRSLFDALSIQPELDAGITSGEFRSANRHLAVDFKARTGITINFSEQA